MRRGPRPDAPGGLHHRMARGIGRTAISRDARDRGDFVGRLSVRAAMQPHRLNPEQMAAALLQKYPHRAPSPFREFEAVEPFTSLRVPTCGGAS